MKKLLLLLFSLMLSFNASGESLVCYYIYNDVVSTNLKTYKRDGDKFMDGRYPLDIVIDNSEVLLLEEVFDDSIFHFMLNKKTRDARFLHMQIGNVSTQIGKCEIID